MESFVEHFGYIAVLVGSFLEGETILVIAGYAARREYLSLPIVISAAFLGSVAGDQFWFFIGRRAGPAIFSKYPALVQKSGKVNELLRRKGALFVVLLRFMYGIRIAGPIVLGASRYPARSFLLLNCLGGIIWAPLIAGAGYFFSHAVETVLGDVRRYEAWALASAVVLGAGIWIVRRLRGRRRHGASGDGA